jgi:hypothetical protein
MADLEMIKKCAEKMGYAPCPYPGIDNSVAEYYDAKNHLWLNYDPLHDDAQAMALLVLLLSSGHRVVIENNAMKCKTYGKKPILCVENGKIYDFSDAEKMRRAIVECVSRLPD